MNPETPIMQRVRLAVGARSDVRIFRNNTGGAWAGKIIERTNSRVVLMEPYWVKFGLCVGSSDLIGWRVGTGQFVALEVKQPGLIATPEQAVFIRNVNAGGGIAAVVHSPEEALSVLGA